MEVKVETDLLTSTESVVSPGSAGGSVQTSALSHQDPLDKRQQWTSNSISCYALLLSCHFGLWGFSLLSCYVSMLLFIKEVNKKSEYIKKETMTVYKFRSASVSATLSAPLWMKSDSSRARRTSPFIACCLGFPSKWVFLGCIQLLISILLGHSNHIAPSNSNSCLNKIANHIGWWTSWVKIVQGKPVSDTAVAAVWK